MFFSAVNHLELCSYWLFCGDPLTVVFCHSRNCKRTGFIHPDSPIRKCSNECFGQSIINNLSNTVFFKDACDFSNPKNTAVKKSTVSISSRFARANDCVLFILVKVVFVALLSGNVWVYGSSTFRAVNMTKGNFRGHLFSLAWLPNTENVFCEWATSVVCFMLYWVIQAQGWEIVRKVNICPRRSRVSMPPEPRRTLHLHSSHASPNKKFWLRVDYL